MRGLGHVCGNLNTFIFVLLLVATRSRTWPRACGRTTSCSISYTSIVFQGCSRSELSSFSLRMRLRISNIYFPSATWIRSPKYYPDVDVRILLGFIMPLL